MLCAAMYQRECIAPRELLCDESPEDRVDSENAAISIGARSLWSCQGWWCKCTLSCSRGIFYQSKFDWMVHSWLGHRRPGSALSVSSATLAESQAC